MLHIIHFVYSKSKCFFSFFSFILHSSSTLFSYKLALLLTCVLLYTFYFKMQVFFYTLIPGHIHVPGVFAYAACSSNAAYASLAACTSVALCLLKNAAIAICAFSSAKFGCASSSTAASNSVLAVAKFIKRMSVCNFVASQNRMVHRCQWCASSWMLQR